jgi:NADPH:quinone reductase-like Zn-dependent oxidoreductase
MKAFVRTEATTQRVQLADVPIPTAPPDGVLVRVEAFGVGIHDRYFIPADASFPYVIGSEGAGVITECGNRVSDVAVGDRVIFTTVLQPPGGTWAEYAVANRSVLIPLPDDATFAQGAAVPIAGSTALECIRELNLSTGDRLFIAGASGAVGTFVIQLAKAKGIRVSASSSESNHGYMKALGVEYAVDYHADTWEREVREWSNGGVDAALAIQPGTGTGSMSVVRDGGTLITVSGDSARVTPVRGISVRQMGHVAETQQQVIDLVSAIAAGEIEVTIEQEYPFERALEALEKTETRHARGKLVVLGRG